VHLSVMSHVVVANCSSDGACAVPYFLLTSDHVLGDVTSATGIPGSPDDDVTLWTTIQTVLLGSLAAFTCAVTVTWYHLCHRYHRYHLCRDGGW